MLYDDKKIPLYVVKRTQEMRKSKSGLDCRKHRNGSLGCRSLELGGREVAFALVNY